jgi:hypothetical protein
LPHNKPKYHIFLFIYTSLKLSITFLESATSLRWFYWDLSPRSN